MLTCLLAVKVLGNIDVDTQNGIIPPLSSSMCIILFRHHRASKQRGPEWNQACQTQSTCSSFSGPWRQDSPGALCWLLIPEEYGSLWKFANAGLAGGSPSIGPLHVCLGTSLPECAHEQPCHNRCGSLQPKPPTPWPSLGARWPLSSHQTSASVPSSTNMYWQLRVRCRDKEDATGTGGLCLCRQPRTPAKTRFSPARSPLSWSPRCET